MEQGVDRSDEKPSAERGKNNHGRKRAEQEGIRHRRRHRPILKQARIRHDEADQRPRGLSQTKRSEPASDTSQIIFLWV